MTPESRRWIEAAVILGRDPKAKVPCPACGEAELEVADHEVDQGRSRWLSCPACQAANVVDRLECG